jgi:hypothetical protein
MPLTAALALCCGTSAFSADDRFFSWQAAANKVGGSEELGFGGLSVASSGLVDNSGTDLAASTGRVTQTFNEDGG